MKRTLAILASALVLLMGMAFTSCMSASTGAQSGVLTERAVILGEVTLQAGGTNCTYDALLKEAKKIYPDTVEVVHVHIDSLNGQTKSIMHGIAVKYR